MEKLVSIKDLNLFGLKYHDCHVLTQQLLSVAIYGILPKSVRVIIIILCLFFNDICSNIINPRNLDELEHEAIIILCKVETYLPS